MDVMRGGAPGDTATFVLGDIVGSTRMWAEATEVMPDALGSLDRLTDVCAERHSGERPIEQGEGDSFFVVFPAAASAMAFALDIQRELRDGPLQVRMGVHTGDALRREDGRWMGHAVNRAARLRDVANGGQILVSGATAELVVEALPDGAWLKDLGTHRLKDLARSEYIRQLCHPDLEADFPPLRSLDKLPHNLPVELTSFVGREAELQALDEMLDRARLVTLTGAGGAGKTRLAIHAAAQRVDSLEGGVWLADLSAVVDPALVPKVLATAMRVTERPLQPVTEAIVSYLGENPALAILDNCEHLLDASAELAEALLRGCSRVLVIATSREPLGVEGEVVYRVRSMSLPGDTSDAACESVNLFVERARAVRPTFALDASTLPAVVELCKRVDGLPLAIELAAARCRAMSPSEICAQLTERMDVLSAGRRGALPRQRTLEASVEWSYDRLTPEEQALLRRLAVFAGGFTLEGAELVGSRDDVDAWHVVDLLTSLVDKSLVQVEETDGRTRYRLLETVRVFAAHRLDEAGELTSTRDRHFQHMLAFAESLERDLYGGRLGAYRALRTEVDNLRAALDWAIDNGRGDDAWRLTAATDLFWIWENFVDWAGRLDTLAPLPGRSRDRIRSLVQGAIGCCSANERAHAAAAITDAEAALEKGDDLGAALILYGRAYVAMINGAPDVFELFDAAIDALEPFGTDYLLLDAIYGRCITYFLAGRLGRAAEDVERMRSLAEASGNELFRLVGLFLDAWIAWSRGAYANVDAALEQVARLGGLPFPALAPFIPLLRLSVLSARGHHDEATRLAAAAVNEAERYGYLPNVAFCAVVKLRIDRRAGRPLDEAAADRVDELTHNSNIAATATRAEYALDAGDVTRARQLADRAIEAASSSTTGGGSMYWAARARARVAVADDDLARGENITHAMLAAASAGGALPRVAEWLETLASIEAASGDDLDAVRLLGASDALRASLGFAIIVPDQEPLQRLHDSLRGRLGDETYGSGLDEGRAMSPEQAVAYAQRRRGSRARPSFGWDSLTPAEQEVTELAAQGLRNAQIAEKLFVAPATVKTHLAHVYAKLGISTRAELASLVVQRRAGATAS